MRAAYDPLVVYIHLSTVFFYSPKYVFLAVYAYVGELDVVVY
jgi:hypothetical protein